MVLLGNKGDLNAIREVDGGRAQVWAQSHGIRPYEVTVINRDGLKDPFCYITWRMSNPGKLWLGITEVLELKIFCFENILISLFVNTLQKICILLIFISTPIEFWEPRAL